MFHFRNVANNEIQTKHENGFLVQLCSAINMEKTIVTLQFRRTQTFIGLTRVYLNLIVFLAIRSLLIDY